MQIIKKEHVNEKSFSFYYFCCNTDAFGAGTADFEDRHAEGHRDQ